MRISILTLASLTVGMGVYLASPVWGFSVFMFPVVLYLLYDQFSREMMWRNDLPKSDETLESLPPTEELKKYFADDSPQVQLEDVRSWDIPALVDRLPYNGWYKDTFTQEGSAWHFDFQFKSIARHFKASAIAKSPREAFALAKKAILDQIQSWHKSRFQDEASGPPKAAPRVLIIDDDVELARALETAMKKIGCETEVATRYEDLHRKITFSDADFIVMDWQLNDNVTADMVMARAARLISAFSDLRRKFHSHPPSIVTYSVLDRDDIQLPAEGMEYFKHLDHWQKPVPFADIMRRASNLMAAH